MCGNFLSNLMPNELKGGGWEVPAALAAAAYTGGASLGAWGGATGAADVGAGSAVGAGADAWGAGAGLDATAAGIAGGVGTAGGAGAAGLGTAGLGTAGLGAAALDTSGAGLAGAAGAADAGTGAPISAGTPSWVSPTASTAASTPSLGSAAVDLAQSAPGAASQGLAGLGIGSPIKDLATAYMGYNALNPKIPQLNPQLMGLAQGPQQAANAAYQQYSSGQLAPADQLSIAQWQQGQEQKMKNYYAQAGLGDSSMMQQQMAQIGQQANAMRDQARQGYLQQGLQASGAAGTPTAQAVYTQLAQDQQAQAAQQNFMRSLALMGATTGG